MSLDSQIIYKQLFQRHKHIRIPLIQRDYAQGRPAEIEVREQFLSTVKEALKKTSNDPTLPLNLDFIYGSVEGREETRFLPLDGQQRLTTLFLLHWYLAWRDEQWDMFTQVFQTGQRSRFAYSVRPSSNDFFDALIHYRPDLRPENVGKLAPLISDQPWYVRNWRLDPTIQSVLHMLEAIHKHFVSSTGFFNRLMDESHPAITFQLLDLQNFGLSDDLYIKMNARGKPLTAFETFKARYEQELKKQFEGRLFNIGEQSFSAADYVARRLDTTWADLFWALRDRRSNLFDSALMNVFRAVALVTRKPDRGAYLNDVGALRLSMPSYTDFHSREWLDEHFTLGIIHLLDVWSAKNGKLTTLLSDSRYFSEKSIFDQIVSSGANRPYAELVQFAAYVAFIVKHDGVVDSLVLQEWMRVIKNLSVNTEYNRLDDMRRSIAGLNLLLDHSYNILQYLAAEDARITGFNEQQIAEEKAKAELLLAHGAWRELIDRAESHGYFQGQIEFLLDFSGILETAGSVGIVSLDEEGHLHRQEEFHDFLQKAEAMFTSSGLVALADFRWERALLCIGNYLLPSGRNHSFLVNPPTEPASWKRLLRGIGTKNLGPRRVLGDLWKRLNSVQNLSTQLDEIIDGTEDLLPWREAFVRTPAAIGYCSRRLIRRGDNGEVYLLQTTQMNGRHAELFTFCFYENTLSDLNQKGRLKPLNLSDYQSEIGTDIEPSVFLYRPFDKSNLWFRIVFKSGEFYTSIRVEDVKFYPLIKAALHEELDFVEQGSNYCKRSTSQLMEIFVCELADKLATIPDLEQ